MADTLRIKSTLPVSLIVAEPHPDPEHPGNSPVLKQTVISPGVNEGVDASMFKAWSGTPQGVGFVASADDIKAGNTDGKIYEMTDDEPEQEFGFEPALQRAADAGSSDAAKGSTITEKGLLKGEDMRTGSDDAVVQPVLTAAAPLKVPATSEAPAASPAAKVAPPAK